MVLAPRNSGENLTVAADIVLSGEPPPGGFGPPTFYSAAYPSKAVTISGEQPRTAECLLGPCVSPASLTRCAPGNAFTGPPANGSAVLLIAGQGLRLEANSCGSSVSHCEQSGISIATVVGALDGAFALRALPPRDSSEVGRLPTIVPAMRRGEGCDVGVEHGLCAGGGGIPGATGLLVHGVNPLLNNECLFVSNILHFAVFRSIYTPARR
eukprot:SAG31_NODE_4810_length_2943_cov_2.007384_3_plen_211_part_00